MSSTIDLSLAETWCSKLCHDLVSPVGAICNGVEFLQDSGGGANDAVELIAQSAGMASDRLKFFRTAYGAAGGQVAMSLDEVSQVAGSYLNWTKSDLTVPEGQGMAVFPEGLGKIFLNHLALLDHCLIYGGNIRLEPEGLFFDQQQQVCGFALAAEGRKAELNDADKEAVLGETSPEDVTPRSIHAYMTGLLTRRLGKNVRVESPDETRLMIYVE